MQKIAHNLSTTKPLHDLYDPVIENQAVYRTHFGILFEGDCLDILPSVHTHSVDTVFADPPFNLSKSKHVAIAGKR